MSSTSEHAAAPGGMMLHALRPMGARDVSDVAEIEREAFPTTWPPTPFRKELSNGLARYLVACERLERARDDTPLPTEAPGPRPSLMGRLLSGLRPALQREQRSLRPSDEALLSGYVGIWFMVDEAHITAIASRESHRGKGVGELLLVGTVELALLRGLRVVTLEVRVSNEPAKSLYRKYGFAEVGLRKRYYADNNEDAYVMTTDPIASPEYRERFAELVSQHQARWGRSLRVVTADG